MFTMYNYRLLAIALKREAQERAKALAAKKGEAYKGKPYDPERDNGLLGNALELAVKDFYHRPLRLSPAGKCDVRIGTRNCEIKQGAGELGSPDGKLCHGSGLVLYVPVLIEDQPLLRQEGYVLERDVFIEALASVPGLIRYKSDRNRVTIQTFWNRTTWEPHGRKLDLMIQALEAAGAEPLEEFLQRTRP